MKGARRVRRSSLCSAAWATVALMTSGTPGDSTQPAECGSHLDCGTDRICDEGKCINPYVTHGYRHTYDYSSQFGSMGGQSILVALFLLALLVDIRRITLRVMVASAALGAGIVALALWNLQFMDFWDTTGGWPLPNWAWSGHLVPLGETLVAAVILWRNARRFRRRLRSGGLGDRHRESDT